MLTKFFLQARIGLLSTGIYHARKVIRRINRIDMNWCNHKEVSKCSLSLRDVLHEGVQILTYRALRELFWVRQAGEHQAASLQASNQESSRNKRIQTAHIMFFLHVKHTIHVDIFDRILLQIKSCRWGDILPQLAQARSRWLCSLDAWELDLGPSNGHLAHLRNLFFGELSPTQRGWKLIPCSLVQVFQASCERHHLLLHPANKHVQEQGLTRQGSPSTVADLHWHIFAWNTHSFC